MSGPTYPVGDPDEPYVDQDLGRAGETVQPGGRGKQRIIDSAPSPRDDDGNAVRSGSSDPETIQVTEGDLTGHGIISTTEPLADDLTGPLTEDCR